MLEKHIWDILALIELKNDDNWHKGWNLVKLAKLGKTGISRGIVRRVLNLRSLGGGRVARLG